jgi:hypothetical protein
MLQIVMAFPEFLSDVVVPIDHTTFCLHNAKLPRHIGRVTRGVDHFDSKLVAGVELPHGHSAAHWRRVHFDLLFKLGFPFRS